MGLSMGDGLLRVMQRAVMLKDLCDRAAEEKVQIEQDVSNALWFYSQEIAIHTEALAPLS